LNTQIPLETPRLALEVITEDHAAELCNLFSDPELHTFVPFVPPTLEEQRRRCARWAAGRSPDGHETWLNWIARCKSTGESVGHFQCGIKKDETASVGYVVARKFQNQGLAAEALQIIFQHLCERGVRVAKAWTDTRNKASHRVAEKLGMVQIEFIKDADHFKGSSSDEFVYSKLLQ
jgi:[ribosomal protein S5]-alanine N-acetyltransferase